MRQCEQMIVDNLTFTTDQGNSNTMQRIDLSVSKDGNSAFSSYIGYVLNPQGYRQNKINYWNLGITNDFTVQLRFWGMSRCMFYGGVLTVHQ